MQPTEQTLLSAAIACSFLGPLSCSLLGTNGQPCVMVSPLAKGLHAQAQRPCLHESDWVPVTACNDAWLIEYHE